MNNDLRDLIKDTKTKINNYLAESMIDIYEGKYDTYDDYLAAANQDLPLITKDTFKYICERHNSLMSKFDEGTQYQKLINDKEHKVIKMVEYRNGKPAVVGIALVTNDYVERRKRG